MHRPTCHKKTLNEKNNLKSGSISRLTLDNFEKHCYELRKTKMSCKQAVQSAAIKLSIANDMLSKTLRQHINENTPCPGFVGKIKSFLLQIIKKQINRVYKKQNAGSVKEPAGLKHYS